MPEEGDHEKGEGGGGEEAAGGGSTEDPRLEALSQYTLKTIKQKPDKWAKMMGLEENVMMINEFLEKPEIRLLVIFANQQGLLTPSKQFPNSTKTKAVYFLKRQADAVKKENIKALLIFGDMSHVPLDQLASIVESLLVPIVANQKNQSKWPKVVSQDLMQHMGGLKGDVLVFTGQVRGKTLLPLPPQADSMVKAAEAQATGSMFDKGLVHAVESVVIEWSHQIRNVLSKSSAQPLLEGKTPGPLVEIDFWKARRADLESILDQLYSEKVLKMSSLLEKSMSSYYPAYKAMVTSVVEAQDEARDISIHLKPLRRHIEEMEEGDFKELPQKMLPFFHCMCLVWANSKHYRQPSRLVVLLQEISNMMVQLTHTFVSEEILRMDADEGLEKLRDAFRVLQCYKTTYYERKGKLAQYFGDRPVVLWEFQPLLVFSRLDKMIAQLRLIEEYFQTVIAFLRLEKVEFGGVKGQALSDMVQRIFQEFQELMTGFAGRSDDPTDISNAKFVADHQTFMRKVADMDQRLAYIMCQAFDDCPCCESIFKLLEMMGSLLERPLIHKDFQYKYPHLLSMYSQELDEAKKIYDRQLALRHTPAGPAINKNMPSVAGLLKWSQELRERVDSHMEKMRKVNHGTMESAEAMIIHNKYDEMMQLISNFEGEVYSEWTQEVDDIAKANLNKPLLVRHPHTKKISVNFDPQLEALLREVKYLRQQDGSNRTIPTSADSVFAQCDMFRKFLQNLDVTVVLYNHINETILDVEYPLIEGKLRFINEQLEKAISQLNWTSDGVWEYIESIRDQVRDLEERVRKSKVNVESISALMATWAQQPLYQRKKDSLLNLEVSRVSVAVTKETRYNQVRQDGQKITELVAENLQHFQAEPGSAVWENYLDYLDDLVVDGLYNCINCSLLYLQQNMDKGVPSLLPLLEAKLELQAPEDIFNLAALVPRVASHLEATNYIKDMEEIVDLSDKREEVSNCVHLVVDQATKYCSTFDGYTYLWVDDREEFLRQFLLYGHIPTPEEIEAAGEGGVPKTPPSLGQFKEQVDKYEKVHGEVEQFEDTKVFDLWFRIDSRPFKQALLNTVKRWSLMFKQHLLNHVSHSLNDLASFVKVTIAGLSVTVPEGEYKALVEVMGHLFAVKERQEGTDTMFEPLKQTIELLKSYGQPLPEDTDQLMIQLPEQWNNVKKLSAVMKQNVAPLQANECNALRRKLASFDVKQHEFREKFRVTAPFQFDAKMPYVRVDKSHRDIKEMEQVMAELQEAAGLFELTVPDFKQLKACRKEVGMLKSLWDMVELVTSSFNDWNSTLWKDINVEQMDMDCKKFVKDIRALDKEMRAWDVFNGMDSMVKNMVTSLKAVGELQNPAIRERHWDQLMQATKVKFVMSDKTNLADLLALNLHKFEDEVRTIVDKATKELSMEKTLGELEVTWSQMQFETEPHHRTGSNLLKSNEELIETLEENQVQLQNMMTSKFVGYFLEQVSSWQKRLATSDSVIHIWFEVQRTWSHLESIFIGSEDIRAQLPDHSKQFDTIDSDFKGLLKEVGMNLNVVAACNRDGLYNQLEDIQKRLSVCEKALSDYLETKRLAFPRFYFISSADLLDILSKGNQPVEVARHLAKLFDSMAKLKFKEEEAGQLTKEAVGMYSKEGEYVTLSSQLMCVGQVESWLSLLLENMQETIRREFVEAVVTYEEMPREQWIFKPPAQVALAGTQIWWTTEVNLVFARLEEGYENALKDYYKKQVTQLNTLIGLLLGNLTSGDRQKIMTICTIDVHARDVVGKLIQQKAENSQAFTWLSQLRHRWDETQKHCFANICDAQFKYAYEYLGNTPRLVITPLTDRCYITLTQSLHLIMSGAPAGPAGTGKTETTKDLGRALGVMVYVFNCSEQMDYKSIGNIYKGLAQTGAWGCFDEFNRISVEVLSVVAVQVKSIQDAIKTKKKRFLFEGSEIKLLPSVGLFITMNPGMPGERNCLRTSRLCSDFELIAEIMLVAEGFIDARILARKFLTLYTLCKDLLSKQDHYDWGLRAIKSVLVVAGSLKRGDRERPEDQVLMRALRDFNTPKIVTDDVPIFMGLIGDLFPALDVPRKRDMDFEAEVKKAVIDLGLQPEEGFILKVVQLEELRNVRHSIFVIGLFSTIMRDLANMTNDSPKWIVLDGDIDPMWIESLNTVMDDNKVLTLASNERVPLTPSMRLMFEIGHLKAATPATVSRAGILFVNPADLGWSPYVQSWIEKREVQSEKANLSILFDRYIPILLDAMRSGRFKKITPIQEVSMIQTLCYLLEAFLTPQNAPPDTAKEIYELYFVFAAIWAFGGSTFQDQLVDYRVEFSKWWVTEFKQFKFPSQGTVFDYFLDHETKKWLPWSEKIPKFELDREKPLQSVIVHTAETTRLRYFLDLLMANRRPVMLVGGAGCGKTIMINDKVLQARRGYSGHDHPFQTTTPLRSCSSRSWRNPWRRRAGRNYGPPGTKKLIYFIDDMNMPAVDTYGTVQPHTLIRQHLDYQHWYDRQKLTLKEIHNVQYVACMNPTAGSFTIDTRLQRHFSVFSVSFPGQDALKTIYSSILQGHLAGASFSSRWSRVASTFLPTAIKFHYIFNLRDLSNIFQGILFTTPECLKTPLDLVRVWLHETCRVYGDKMIEDKDMETFANLKADIVKTSFEDMDQEVLKAEPLIYCHFASGIGEPKYLAVPSWESLKKILEEALDSYNEINAMMNLVLFEDAMQHICRINRILESPRGNALLVGVGGSGKQSLTRLAAFTDLAGLYMKAGVKNVGTVFLLTDGQIAEEKFLVLVNDLLASGEIPDLFPDDEVQNIVGSVRNEVKGMGIQDTKENCWAFFIERVRRQLKISLYQNLLTKKYGELMGNMERLEGGLEKLKSTAAQVDDLKEKLKAQEVELKQKNEDADALIKRVAVEQEKVGKEKAFADEEEKKVAKINDEVSKKQRDCETDLAKAETSAEGEAAETALNTLNKNNLTELKSFGKPPGAVVNVVAAVMVLMSPPAKIPKDRSWNTGKVMMSKVDQFLESLIKFDKENIADPNLKAIRPYLEDPEFEPEFIRSKSFAAAGLCAWAINIVRFYEVFCDVEPKRNALKAANAELAAAQEKLSKIKARIKELDDNLAELTREFETATAAKLKCQQEAEATARTISLANRLVGGLASEKVRWAESVQSFKKDEKTLAGDLLLTASYLSYVGCFTRSYREDLLNGKWIPFLKTLELTSFAVPYTYAGTLDAIEQAVSNGDCLLLENIEESVDAVLDPLLGRNTIKKGKCIKIGDKEVEYHPKFRLILQTKLANPHYKPEMQAQTTLINFTVTRDGLEDQLLAEVVATERPDLEKTKAELTRQQNEFKITLKDLEDSLLSRLSAAGGNFLGDTALVENLETTKRTANQPALPVLLKAFSVVFHNAIDKADKSDDLKQRVSNLIDSITYMVFVYTSRGLFERDKLIFTSQVTFLLRQLVTINSIPKTGFNYGKQIEPTELDFLLRFPATPNVTSPVDFLSHLCWGGIRSLSNLEAFKNLDKDIEGSAKRWKKFVDSECPEKEKFPGEWKNKTSLQRLCMMRALRPDRMTYAVTILPGDISRYSCVLVLSPGVDPLKDVESLGKKLGFTMDNGNFHNVSLGQGQEDVAERALDVAAKDGHWVILQNIHLVAKWLARLDKKLEQYSEGSNKAYRVYMSAEPAGSREGHIIPQVILECSIKITNEPPTGMRANLHKALDNFTQNHFVPPNGYTFPSRIMNGQSRSFRPVGLKGEAIADNILTKLEHLAGNSHNFFEAALQEARRGIDTFHEIVYSDAVALAHSVEIEESCPRMQATNFIGQIHLQLMLASITDEHELFQCRTI
eukprot:Em0006g952a